MKACSYHCTILEVEPPCPLTCMSEITRQKQSDNLSELKRKVLRSEDESACRRAVRECDENIHAVRCSSTLFESRFRSPEAASACQVRERECAVFRSDDLGNHHFCFLYHHFDDELDSHVTSARRRKMPPDRACCQGIAVQPQVTLHNLNQTVKSVQESIRMKSHARRKERSSQALRWSDGWNPQAQRTTEDIRTPSPKSICLRLNLWSAQQQVRKLSLRHRVSEQQVAQVSLPTTCVA